MSALHHLLFPVMLVLLTIYSNVNAETVANRHTLSLEEKIRKIEALKKLPEGDREYSGKYVMQFDGPEESAKDLGERHGFQFEKQSLKYLKNFYVFTDGQTRTRDQVKQAVEKMKLENKRLKDFFEEAKTRPKSLTVTPAPLLSFNVTDAYWSKQWHLHPSTSPALGVYDAWENGYSGKGVVMAIVDDGMDIDHIDLVDNYNLTLSYNFVYEGTDGRHIHDFNGHGTKCAGLAAASKNNECVIGVAYEATIASLRILDEYSSDVATAGALSHELDAIDIYSNSWGYPGAGSGFEPLYVLELNALIQGTTEGRNGKGAIYLFAAGNDGYVLDDCNAAGLINNIYSIAVNSLAADGSPAGYSEQCTCIMTATYGGQGDVLIATTARNDTCTDDFLGTSAACPIAAGIVALALQANPDLTWRDVQHLIAETSTYDGVPGNVSQTNAAGKNVSVSHGFGIMNADGMVKTALTWKTVPEKITCFSEFLIVLKCCTETVEATYDFQNCHIRYLEHVQVKVDFRALWREYTEIHLVSPSGTDSRILRQRRLDSSYESEAWTFMTVFKWGEDPIGNWTIRMLDFVNCDNEVYLNGWALTLHGTVTDPHAGAPGNGTLGGRCDEATPCTGGTDCLLNFNVCVECNIPDYRVVNGFCAKDMKIGGYCNSNMSCDAVDSWCNVNNTCEICEPGFQKYDDQCFEDGKLNGYCDFGVSCTEVDVGCDWLNGRCINCTNGYHVIYGYCMEDGTIAGYCDSDITCDTTDSQACSPTSNLCEYCYTMYGQHIINGFCFDDGTMGGYCSNSVPCTDTGSGCDLEMNLCTACADEGVRIVDSVCRLDGFLHGYCNETLACKDASGCDPEVNVCVECTSPGYRIVQNGFCREDRKVDGYCDSNTRCTSDRSGCSAENNVCVICYAGHHLHNGFCVQGKYIAAETRSVDYEPSGGTIAGSVLGGIVSGIAVTAPGFVILFKKVLAAKIGPVSQNGGYNPHQNGNSKFS